MSLSRRTIVNKPIVIKRRLPLSESTIISSRMRQISSGTADTSVSPQQQQQSSSFSTTRVARTMGSITSVCDSFFVLIKVWIVPVQKFLLKQWQGLSADAQDFLILELFFLMNQENQVFRFYY